MAGTAIFVVARTERNAGAFLQLIFSRAVERREA
jgi:hypothetical protein